MFFFLYALLSIAVCGVVVASVLVVQEGGWAMPMDPSGDYERERTDACVAVARSSPTVAGTVWGPIGLGPPVWLRHACSTR